MAVAKMKRLELAGLLTDRTRWLDALQAAEVVEIEGSAGEEGLGAETTSRKEIDDQAADLDHEMGDVERTLAFIERFFPVRPNFIQQFSGVKMYLTPSEFDAMSRDRELTADWVAQGQELNNSFTQLLHERASLLSDQKALTPWSGLDLTQDDLDGTVKVKVMLGSVETKSEETLRQLLGGAEFGAVADVVARDDRLCYVVIFASRSGSDSLNSLLSTAGFASVSLPGFGHSVVERLASIDAALKRLDDQEVRVRERIAGLAERRPQLQAVYDFLRNEKYKLTAAQGFASGERSFYFKGWVRDADLPKLEQAVAKLDRPHYLLVRDFEEDETPPSTLENRPLVTPFEALVQGFSYPKYGEIDPTRFMAPFFFVFYGFAVGDAGYGLIIALINLALLKFLPMGRTGKKLASMFVLGSVSAIIMGLGTAGFFGNIVKFRPLFGLDPVSQPQQVLLLALGLGLIQMFFGLFMSGFVNASGSGVLAALSKEGAYGLFLLSALLYLGKGYVGLGAYGKPITYLFLGSVALVLLGATYGRKGFAKLLGIPSGLFTIYGSIGFFSDVLSYSRVMALALSGAVVANIINQFAVQAFRSPMFGLGYIFGAAIFVFGHALNMGLGMLGAYVHASRLQYLEFFGKFYEGGGRPFSPLKPSYKYTQIVEEREA